MWIVGTLKRLSSELEHLQSIKRKNEEKHALICFLDLKRLFFSNIK